MRETLLKGITPLVRECFQVYEISIQQIDEETPLYGQGHLDSIALVTLISDIDSYLAENYDFMGTLADDRAMSPGKSPFRTLGTLLDMICSLPQEMIRRRDSAND